MVAHAFGKTKACANMMPPRNASPGDEFKSMGLSRPFFCSMYRRSRRAVLMPAHFIILVAWACPAKNSIQSKVVSWAFAVYCRYRGKTYFNKVLDSNH